MTQRIDIVAEYLCENKYPCPSGPTDTRAILDALSCVESNKPPVAQYDLNVFNGDTDYGCRLNMVLGTLAWVAAEIEAGLYRKPDRSNISKRVMELRQRLEQVQ